MHATTIFMLIAFYTEFEDILPAGFDNTGNEAEIGQFTEAKTRHLEFTQGSSRSASELASIAETDWRGVFWKFIERELGCEPFFITLA
jgi:hypothetical protein